MPSDARRILLEHLIDDAGLFPPARLGMPAALAVHAANRVGPRAWVAGRFVAPATRLAEIAPAWPEGLAGLRLAVVADRAGSADSLGFGAALAADLAEAAAVESGERPIRVEQLEARLPEAAAAGDLWAAVRATPFAGAVSAFAESPDSTDPDALRGTVAAVAEARAGGASRLGAKIRTGGLEQRLVPEASTVAGFLAAVIVADIPFKATAGLHHPVRGIDPASGLRMHGFVNVLVATALLRAGAVDERGAAEVIGEEDPAAFAFGPDAIGWRERTVAADALSSLRATAMTAYGSCSFDEPTGDLAALGWMP